jgi:predicted enzyme related to lactoylglutathione lyase
MSNAVIEFQIIATNPEATAAFYRQLFGWTVDADNALGYRRIATGSAEGIQGGIWPAPPQAPTFVQLFIAVDDVAQSVAEAEKLGAKVLIPATTLPEGDVMAVLQDPQGMTFGLSKRRVV